jgi:hypothetical protein
MVSRTHRLLATTSILALLTGAAACEGEVSEDGANLEVEGVGDE